MSAPHSVAQVSLSTSSWIDDVTAELPMFALTFTRKLRPMIIGSDSGWLTLAGTIARPRATSERTSSASTPSRVATNCISGVFAFRSSERVEVANVMALLGVENSDEHQIALRGLGNGECIFRDLEGRAGRIGIDLISDEMRQWLDTNPTRSRPDADVPRAVAGPAYSSTSSRARIHGPRSGGSPTSASAPGPLVS